MSEKKSGPLYGIGGVTLLTVLLVLCLTMFAVLALSSAQADLRLSTKNADAVTAYYRADSQAVSLMVRAAELWPAGGDRPVTADFTAALGDDIDLQSEWVGVGIALDAEIPVQEGQVLRLSLYLKPAGGADRWEILEWRVLAPQQDEADVSTLPVWIPPAS